MQNGIPQSLREYFGNGKFDDGSLIRNIQREIQANKLVNNVTVAEKNKSNEKKPSSGGVLSPKTIQLPICSTTKSHRFNHMSHSVFAQSHTTPTAKTLFTGNNEDTAVLILDGTYIYIQKSSYHKFQKKTYSMHKNRPLVKPMIIVGSDGYILSVLGPYYANGHNNDASITKHLFKTNAEDIKKWIKDDDVLVVDRGFREMLKLSLRV
ncbi:Hypothetical predicted protein [Mytilus galloprovincialis]|uniref:DDE Tnp4 domain-containing protein n=1 Tax=Mytilus galloprovincialis TaxID=29158 RepID=A0A8B6FK71_MYTGA|nr:Hypothetical predicted protein [Mytilus galloprovincialis]